MFAEASDAKYALPLHITRQVEAVLREYEAVLKRGGGVAFEAFLGRVEAPGRDLLIKEFALLALDHLTGAGALNPGEDLLNANPNLRADLECMLRGDDESRTARMDDRTRRFEKASGLVIRCPHCRSTIELIVDAPLVDIGCPNCGGSFSLVSDALLTRDAATFTKLAHFELVERLGMGEFGTVWKARDTMLDRTVALKIPRRERLDALSIEKFMREARAAAQLRHPNIVSTHEVGRHGDTLYIVSDYVRGASLADMIADQRLEFRESVVMASKVADALEHAHSCGVVHRDLKPSNILVDDHGEPHLMDFGLAKRKETEVTITTDGAIVGTPAYMSPEQARGDTSQVDGRSDLYSLGVILFQLLTGELPFRGSIRMLLQKVISDDPPGPRTLDGRVPKDLDTICLKCMEKDPTRRYGTAADLAADLRRWLVGEPIAARRIGHMGRTLRWAQRNPVISLLLAATTASLLAATLSSSYFGWRAAQSALRADQQATEVTSTLYDSLLQEIRLTLEVRNQGYGEKVRQLIERARRLPTSRIDKDDLRRQLVHSMGDFVAYPPVVIKPAAGEASSIQLSRDGREVIVGLEDGRLFSFDTQSGQQREELDAFVSQVQSIALNADESRLFAADSSGQVRVWQRTQDRWMAERAFRLTDDVATSAVFFSPHGELAARVNGSLIEAWNVAGASKLRIYPTKPTWDIQNAMFDLTGRRLIGSYEDKESDAVGWVFWSLDTGEQLHVQSMTSLGSSYPNAVDFAGNFGRFAIGFDEALLIYDVKDFQRTSFFGFDATKAVAFSSAQPYLAAVNIRGRITLWNSTTNRQLAALQQPRSKRSRDDLSFSADGTRLAASNADSIHVWDLTKSDEKIVAIGHGGAIPCAAFHPNGRLLATGGKDHLVRFWNPSTGQLQRSIDVGQRVQALAFGAQGRLLAVGCVGGTVAPRLKFIDVSSGQIISQQNPATDDVHSLAWVDSPDSRFIAACGPAGVALWKSSGDSPPRMEQALKLDRTRCLAVVLNKEARLMVWAQDDSMLQAWDVVSARQKPLHAPPMLSGWHGLAFMPGGKSIIYVSNAGVAEIWNIEEDRRVRSVGARGTFSAPHIALSPDGKWFAALTEPDVVSVWRLSTGEHIFSLRPEAGTVWSLAWDASDSQLAVGQSDGSLAVWSLPRIRAKLSEAGLSWQDEQ